MRVLNVQLDVDQRELITLPVGARLLKVVIKGGRPHLYFIADELVKGLEHRVFRIVCAGENIFDPTGWDYIDSFQLNDWFVGHLFEQPTSGGAPDKIDKRYNQDFIDIKRELGEK
jgi:hypothetical protein